MHARISVLRALDRHVRCIFNPDRKGTHWGQTEAKAKTMSQRETDDSRYLRRF
jgi:hypothetical protein